MLARAGSSPPRDFSPAPVVPLGTTQVAGRKRKLGGTSSHAAESPAPPDGATPEPVAAPTNERLALVLRKLDERPRLTISRYPIFVPVSENSPYNTTESIPMNRMGFRYIPAGLGPVGTVTCRTIESKPTNFRVSWEDRSAYIKVTRDGLGLCGERGFRSARCNVPVREGNWYMEITIEHGGGDPSPEPASEASHVRLGWGRREAPLNAPVGLDGYSYGIRDKTGEKVTLSRPRPYSRPLKTGDIVGMYISLPRRERTEEQRRDPYDPAQLKRVRIAIDSKGQEYFEILEVPASKEMKTLMESTNNTPTPNALPPSTNKKSATTKNLPTRGRGKNAGPATKPLRNLPTLPGSHVAFFVNGESQGVAFEDLYDYLQLRSTERKPKEKQRRIKDGALEHKENPFDDGTLGYYAQISLFNGARVKLNPGPDFAFNPPPDIEGLLRGKDPMVTDDDSTPIKPNWRPISDRYPEYMQEQWALDAQEQKDWQAAAAEQAELDLIENKEEERRARKRQQTEAKKQAKKDAEVEFLRATMDVPDAPVAPSGHQGSPLRQEAANAMDISGQADRFYSPAPSAEPPSRSETLRERQYSPSRSEVSAHREDHRGSSPAREHSRERFVSQRQDGNAPYSHGNPEGQLHDEDREKNGNSAAHPPSRSDESGDDGEGGRHEDEETWDPALDDNHHPTQDD